MPANTYGRQVVLVLTNKSGASVAAGDVVVIDTTTDESFTTTTTGRAELSVGVAQETIASNAIGRVLTSGYAALINVPASVTRGHYIETHTVVKQATGSATRRSGSLGQFGKTSATPSGWVWGNTDQTASAASATFTTVDALQGADVAVAAATYTDSCSVSLVAGTWDVWGWVNTNGNSANSTDYETYGQLYNSTDAAQVGQNHHGSRKGTTAQGVTVPVFIGALVLAGTKTIKLRCYCDLATTLYGTTSLNAGGGSKIHAMKIA